MKRPFALIAVLLSAGATPVLAQYGAPPPQPSPTAPDAAATTTAQAKMPRPSKAASKAILDLQKAVQAKDAATYPTALAAAKAAAKTNEDRYLIARLQLNKAFDDKDDAAMGAAIAEIAATNVLDSATVAKLLLGVGGSNYSAKQYDRAAAAFERAIALDPSNLDAITNLAETRFAQGRKAEAVPLLQKVIAADVAAGRKPEESLYRRAFGIAYDSRLPASVEIGRQWVAAYPNVTSWRNVLAAYQNLNKPTAEQALNLLRLMRAVGALDSPIDFSIYASAAVDQGNYVEAQAIIDEGLGKQSIRANDRLIKEITDILKAKPKATAADLETATKDAKTAAAFVRIGDRYFGMGNYAKAIELYRMAEGKAGAEASLINMHLGMALARSGDKTGAAAAFKNVTGPDAPIAQFWTMYLNQAV